MPLRRCYHSGHGGAQAECWLETTVVTWLQDGPDGSGDPVIRKLFGVGLHKALKAEEGDEAVEVRRHRRLCWDPAAG